MNRVAACVIIFVVAIAPAVAASDGRYAIQAHADRADGSSKCTCRAAVLEGTVVVMEEAFTLGAGETGVHRSGSQTRKGGEVDRRLSCRIESDGASAHVEFTEVSSGTPPATSKLTADVAVKTH